MAEKESKNKWHTPAERIMMLGFAAVILLGTILLCLPVSAADGLLARRPVYRNDICLRDGPCHRSDGDDMEYLWKNCDPRVDSVRRSWHHGVPDDGVSDPAPENQSAEP